MVKTASRILMTKRVEVESTRKTTTTADIITAVTNQMGRSWSRSLYQISKIKVHKSCGKESMKGVRILLSNYDIV